jgi:hypothetical protein
VNIDDALISYRDELVEASARWKAARRRRGRLVLLASGALAAVVAIGSTAVAATGWLVGSPAPPSVKSDFGSYATQLGFNPEPGHSVLVASDAPYQLYVTTNRQGTYCVLVSAPWKRPGPHGEGGDCLSERITSTRFWAGTAGIASGPSGSTQVVFDGRTTDPAAVSVRFATPDGRTVTAPIGSSGFFIAGTDVNADPCRPWSPTFVFLDSSGNAVGETSHEALGACLETTTSRGGG